MQLSKYDTMKRNVLAACFIRTDSVLAKCGERGYIYIYINYIHITSNLRRPLV